MSEALKQAVGVRIRTARERAKLSQEALASAVGRTPESISNIERGLQLPALDTLIALGNALHLPLPDLLAELLAGAAESRAISPERARNEARIADIVRGLSDNAVAVAAEQIRALKGVG